MDSDNQYGNIDGREMAVIKPGEVEILRTLDPARAQARIDHYMAQVRDIVAAGNLVIPSTYPNDPKDPSVREAAVKVAILYAAELGIPPISGLRSIYFVNNRPCLHSDGPPAVALASGLVGDMWSDVFGYGIIENFAGGGGLLGTVAESLRGPVQLAAAKAMEDAVNDKNWRCAFALVWRKGFVMPVVRIFSMTDAHKAGVFTKKGEIWEKHTWRMLLARARTFACRDAVPEAYQGLPTIEEAQEIEAREGGGKPVEVAGVRTVDSILSEAATSANMRAKEDMEADRTRVRAMLKTKFTGCAGPAWRLCANTLFGGAEPTTADQWAGASFFLTELDLKDGRLKDPKLTAPKEETAAA